MTKWLHAYSFIFYLSFSDDFTMNRTSWVLMTSLRLLRAIRQPQLQSSLSVLTDSTDTDDEPFESYNRTKCRYRRPSYVVAIIYIMTPLLFKFYVYENGRL